MLDQIEVEMKSTPAFIDDGDDIFGPPRTHATGYCAPKNRLSMISPKYRQKEERRKVLKISCSKLKKIDDPEISLCRSVLINNTMKRLQQEVREEKLQKQQLNYPKCVDSGGGGVGGDNNFLNIKSEFMKNELKAAYDESPLLDVSGDADFDKMQRNEINESVKSVLEDATTDSVTAAAASKRSYDEFVDNCDIQDVLSQFYMTPTPRMLTSIDDDDDLTTTAAAATAPANDDGNPAKRFKSDFADSATDCCGSNKMMTPIQMQMQYINNNLPDSSPTTTTTNSFTCGQASMFSEMQIQNNVYHSLIASLET